MDVQATPRLYTSQLVLVQLLDGEGPGLAMKTILSSPSRPTTSSRTSPSMLTRCPNPESTAIRRSKDTMYAKGGCALGPFNDELFPSFLTSMHFLGPGLYRWNRIPCGFAHPLPAISWSTAMAKLRNCCRRDVRTKVRWIGIDGYVL